MRYMTEALGGRSEPPTEEERYFDAFKTYPPELSPDETTDDLKQRVEVHWSLATRATDPAEAERLMHEAAYLEGKLRSLEQLARSAIRHTA